MNGQASELQNQLPPWQSLPCARLGGGNRDQLHLPTGSRRPSGDGRDKGRVMHEQKRDKNHGVPDFSIARNEPGRPLQTDHCRKIRRAIDGTCAQVSASGRPSSFGRQRDFHPKPTRNLPSPQKALVSGPKNFHPKPTRILPFAYRHMLQRCVGPWKRARLSWLVWSSVGVSQQEAHR